MKTIYDAHNQLFNSINRLNLHRYTTDSLDKNSLISIKGKMVNRRTHRPEKAGQLILKELSDIFRLKLKDPDIGFATVTEVRMTKDLRQATVFISIYGDNSARQTTLTAVNKAKGFIKRELANSVKMRFMPELIFKLDTTLDQAEKLDSLFNSIDKVTVDNENDENNPDSKTDSQSDSLDDSHQWHQVENHRTALGRKREYFNKQQKQKLATKTNK